MHGRSGQQPETGRRGFSLRLLFFILLAFGSCLYGAAAPAAAPPAPLRTVVQNGHTMDIVSIAFARDESVFASLDGFGRVKVWQLPEGRLLASWKINDENTAGGSTDNAALIAFDDTGHLVAVENNILSRWDPLTGRLEEKKKPGFDAEAGLAISLNGSVLASWRMTKFAGTSPGKFKIDLWSVQTGRLMRSLEDAGECDVLLSPSGSAAGCFRAAGAGYSLTMWRTGDGSLIRSGSIDISGTGTGGSPPPRAVALSPDGGLIVFGREPVRGSAVASLEVRRTSDMSPVKTIPVAGVDHPSTFSEDGKFFIYFDRPAGTKTETIRVLNTARWESVYESRKEMTTSLAISPTSRFIAEGAGGMMGSGAYYLTYLVTLHDLKRGSGRTIYEEGKWTDHLAISPDGTWIVLNEQRGMPDNPREEDIVLSRLRLVSLRDGTTIWEKRGEEGDRFKNMGYSQKGQHLIARDLENVHIWEMPSGRPAGKFSIAYDKFNTGLAISPDGRFFAAVDGSNPVKPAVYLFRSSDGTRVMALQRNASRGEKTTTEALAFSPDGRYVAKTVFSDMSTGPADNSGPGQQVQVELWSTAGREKPRIIDAGRYSDRESSRSLDRQPLSTDVLAFASDGKHLLVGGKVFRLSDGKLAAAVETPGDAALGSLGPFYEGAGRSLSISPRGRIYAQQTQDGGIRIVDLAGGKERATLYTFPGSSVTVTPEGFFSGSGKFDKEVHFVRGKEIYDFNQFYDAFYRPDLVMMKLRGEDISGYSSGLNIEEALRNPPPEVSIVAPASGGTTNLRHLTVTVRVSDTGGGTGDVRVFNNGKLVHSRGIYRIAATGTEGEAVPGKNPSSPYRIASRGAAIMSARPSGNRQAPAFTLTPPQQGTQELSCDIDLIRGQNTLSVAAFNGPNTVMSAMKTITVGADVPQRKPRLFSLVMGNDHFRDKQIDLSFAVKDARDFAAMIRKASGGLFEKVVVEVLADASKAQFMKSINDIAGNVHPEDVFLFYAASHGLARDDLYYLFTSGFDGSTLDDETSISSVELMEFSKTIPSLQQIYVLDTCQAGGAGSVVLGLYDSRISVLAKSLGMHIMAGSKTYQQAIDNYEGNGLFTHFLLKGFGGRADINGDRKVSVMEMNPYLLRSMKAASQGRQEPFIRTFGRDLIITGPAAP